MKRTLQALAVVVLIAPLVAEAAKPSVVPLKARVFGTVVDEQDTITYFHDNGVTGCPDAPSTLYSALIPDAIAPQVAEARSTMLAPNFSPPPDDQQQQHGLPGDELATNGTKHRSDTLVRGA